MGLFNNIKNVFARSGETVTAPTPTTTISQVTTPGPRTGISVTQPVGGPMTVATVYACVNIIADAVANLPLQYMRLKDGVYVEDTNSRLHYLLKVRPCPYMSAFDFWKGVVQNLLLRGNAYIVPVYSTMTMDIDYLVPVNPLSVSHDTLNDTYYITDTAAGICGKYNEADIIHIKNFSFDGKQGISTLHFARISTSIAATGDAETLSRFRSGGTVKGILTNDTTSRGFGEYQDEELEKAATDIDHQFNVDGKHIVSIPAQAKFETTSMSSTDMQFLETRKFSVRDICRFFGVHPSKVFDDTSNNYKSAEMSNVDFYSQTVNPLLRKIEDELAGKLIPESLCCKRKFEHDRRGLYVCDLDSRVKYQTATIAAGLYTVNEWRAAENKPSVEGGDKVLVSANLKDINEASAQAQSKPKEDGQE